MKRISYISVCLCILSLTFSGCSRFSFEGESAPLSKKVISVSVPADPIPPAVKPLPPVTPAEVPEKKLPRKIPRQVDQNLLPQNLPVEDPLSKIPLETSRPPGSNALATDSGNNPTTVPDNASVVYDGVTFTEDVTWRGTVLVKGFVVVAPQATLTLEPGTIVRFSGPAAKNITPRLIVQGRIQAVGTYQRPILITSGRSKAARGDWGGISLVSSEKRNILEHCRIEYADSGIDARFSTVSLKMVSITKSNTSILAHDAVVQMTGGNIAESETGIEAFDSEFDMRDAVIANCQRGFVMNRSSVGISSFKIRGNEQYGLVSDDCRVKISATEFSANGTGASFKGGEGQILMSRFIKNRETALHLSGSRMKIQRCRFSDNSRDAIRLEDGRALVSGNIFSSNYGFNLYNAGREDVNALLNWWGSSEQSVITRKIHDAVLDPRSGTVQVFPWLTEKPPLIP